MLYNLLAMYDISCKNNIGIVFSILIGAVFLWAGVYYFNKIRPYNNFLIYGDKAMAKEDYDNAVKWYNQVEIYKKSSDIDKKIQIVSILKKSKENYTVAIKKMNNEDYLNAIDSFKKVNKQDAKRYSDSQSKITKCKKLYISDNFNKAKDDIKNNKFDDANACLNNIFKLDASNTDAKKLKNDIINTIQKQKDQAVASTVSTQTSTASGPVSFDEALAMVLKAEFPDNKYVKLKENTGDAYVSPDSSILNGNKGVKCESDYRGRGIGYETTEATPTQAEFNGDNGQFITKICYNFALSVGGHILGGYYVEASTGKTYKYIAGNVTSIN